MHPNVLSTKSPLRTGAYEGSTNMFFLPSKLFEAQITDLFDEVWPSVTAMKLLRWQVLGYYQECCISNNSRLREKFVEPEDRTNRPNLYRTCIDENWNDTEFKIARNLLINLFAYYEEWCDSILNILGLSGELRGKVLQFPIIDLDNIIKDGNPILISSFYEIYKTKNKNHSLIYLNKWLEFYRYFKECRNAIVHNGGQTTPAVVDCYNRILDFTAEDLNVKEKPQIFSSDCGNPIQLSLRGIVGFSQFVIKIVSTLDVEFIRSKGADIYYVEQLKAHSDDNIANVHFEKEKFVKHLSGKAHFLNPADKLNIFNLISQLW